MKRSSFTLALLSAGLLLLAQGTERTALAAQRVSLVVVLGPTTDIADLSMADLRRSFAGGAVNDKSGERLIPFNHSPRSADRVGFDRTLLGMEPDEVSRFWIDRKIRGLSGPPRSLESAALLLRLVPRLPGAISYARAAQVAKNVRIVRINGKLPGDPGYPLVYTE